MNLPCIRSQMRLSILVLFFLLPASLILAQSQKQIMGRTEDALFLPMGLPMKARLDSGAKTTSVRATDITFFVRENAAWVRFRMLGSNKKSITLERKVVRRVRIKRHRAESTSRPVVLLGICVGSVYREAEVNLAKRTRFKYPLLIGRNFMSGGIVIDPELTFTAKPDCKPQ